jgi:hypothetical protein
LESLATPLPQIKSWTVFGPSEVMGNLDLNRAESIHFSCIDSGYGFKTAFLPSGLTTLCLTDINFDSDTILGHGPQLLPHLIELRLVDSNFEGRLQDYLECPKLKNLYLESAEFMAVKELPTDDITLVESSLSHPVSFPSFPELECLYVCGGEVDGEAVNALHSCPSLKHLTIRECRIEEFIPSFTTAIADSESFPALKSLCIDKYWSIEPWSQREFAHYCVSKRPGLAVSVKNR